MTRLFAYVLSPWRLSLWDMSLSLGGFGNNFLAFLIPSLCCVFGFVVIRLMKRKMVSRMKTIFTLLISLMLLGSGFAYAGNYTGSAHGNTSTGVNSDSRGGPDTSDYTTGNCAHCHLYQHQSLDGIASNTALSPQARSDIIPFCLDCHNTAQDDSETITWNLGTIDDIHGEGNITGAAFLDVLDGINDGDITEDEEGNYSISCIVCHEPHGTSNVMLIREEVNGAALGGTIPTIIPTNCTPPFSTGNKELGYLCNRCHEDDGDYYGSQYENRWYWVHHASSDHPYSLRKCRACHTSGSNSGHASSRNPIDCNCCHYHGSTDSSAPAYQRTNRRTF